MLCPLWALQQPGVRCFTPSSLQKMSVSRLFDIGNIHHLNYTIEIFTNADVLMVLAAMVACDVLKTTLCEKARFFKLGLVAWSWSSSLVC